MISKQHEFLFVPVPKCAGTSLRKTLQPYSEINSFKAIYGEETSTEIIRRMRQKIFRPEKYFKTILTEPKTHLRAVKELTRPEYFMFTFVRNPYARAVSLWKYLKPKMSFVQFVDWLDDNGAKKNFHDLAHIKPCSFYFNLYKDMFPNHYVGRVENINKDIKYVCKQLDLSSLCVPKINQTKHLAYHHYYTEELAKRIEEIYSEDFKLFDYKF